VAAQEEQDERVVGVVVQADRRQRAARDRVLAALPGLFLPEEIGQAARGHRDQPRARVVRHPLGGPLGGRRDHGFLHRVLGGVEVAVPAYDRAEGLRRELTQQALDREGHAVISSRPSMIGRTST
jgi:hypothetical protein